VLGGTGAVFVAAVVVGAAVVDGLDVTALVVGGAVVEAIVVVIARPAIEVVTSLDSAGEPDRDGADGDGPDGDGPDGDPPVDAATGAEAATSVPLAPSGPPLEQPRIATAPTRHSTATLDARRHRGPPGAAAIGPVYAMRQP
jgi:hypothetical protein